MSSKSVIFDLDGTLIDSQESILNALRITLNKCGLRAAVPISSELVGPPLMDTLSRITAIKDAFILNMVSNEFKRYYDNEGYKQSTAYPGITYLLKSLHSQDFALYVATNKRLIPTQKIIDQLSWRDLFSEIYCIDLHVNNPFKNKAEMISALLDERLIDKKSVIYVGDRVEDYEAAKLNGLPCILVNWGYGEIRSKSNEEHYCVDNSIELLTTLQRLL
jgi:phosphoglycolate phosphatase